MGMVRDKMTVGIIQARMGSKRLKGKSMLPLAGKPLIYRFIERVKRSRLLDTIVLATTNKEEDHVLCEVGRELGIHCFGGSENDLVERIYNCALEYDAKTIVRLCADNPLIEAEEIDRAISSFKIGSKYCMFSNTHNIRENGYPDGLGCEVYGIEMFDWLDENIKDEEKREHPHKHFYEIDAVNTITCPKHIEGYKHLKLDVNTQEEYDFIKGIYERFGHNDFHFTDYMEVI